MLALARHARDRPGAQNLVPGGGRGAELRGQREAPAREDLRRIWIQPAAGDAGGALGAGRQPPAPGAHRARRAAGLSGSGLVDAEVHAFLDRHDYPFERVADPAERAGRIAAALSEGSVVGFVSGRMEFGPRALGGRSILGDPPIPKPRSR